MFVQSGREGPNMWNKAAVEGTFSVSISRLTYYPKQQLYFQFTRFLCWDYTSIYPVQADGSQMNDTCVNTPRTERKRLLDGNKSGTF